MTALTELQRTIKKVTLPYPVMVGGGIFKSHEPITKTAATEIIGEWGSITSERKSGNGGVDYYAHYEVRHGQTVLIYALNSIGLTNPGIAYVEQHARNGILRHADCGKPLPINISGEGVDDTIVLMKKAITCGFPIVTVNAACPNKIGTDSKPMPIMCFDMESMHELIERADNEIGPTESVIMLKVSTGMPRPFLSRICVLLKDSKTFDGIITGNTVPNGMAYLPTGEPAIRTANGVREGGMSGPAIKPLSMSQTGFAADFFGGTKEVWGCGGVESAADVQDYFRAGATVVQLVTAFRENHESPVFIRSLLEDLID